MPVVRGHLGRDRPYKWRPAFHLKSQQSTLGVRQVTALEARGRNTVALRRHLQPLASVNKD